MTETKSGSLSSLLEELKAAEEVKDAVRISSALDSLIANAASFAQESAELHKEVAARIGAVLEANIKRMSFDVVEKGAKATAELAKLEAGRAACVSDTRLMKVLVGLLDLSGQPGVQTQACRALGNVCYENEEGRVQVLGKEGGLERVVNLAKQAIKQERPMRNVVAGFLLNLLAGQEETQRKALDLGAVGVLADFLEADNRDKEEPTHILTILNLLADLGGELLDERVCRALVTLLGHTSSPEVSEMCLELMLAQSDNESIKTHLAKAGLCEQLNCLAQKHKDLLADDEARGLLKMACDLMVSVLTGDEAMEILYLNGEGRVFREITDWLSADDEDLQVTAVLAMGNFARTDKHCTQIVEKGISKKLLALVLKNNSVSGGIRLQHALLSALRNLAIPAENKPLLLQEGLISSVLPMTEVPTFPVIFKLLGTLRMAIDGQEGAATELGKNEALLSKLVSWSTTEDHPGVQGEASRLLAWTVKNSKSCEVVKCVAGAGGVKTLVAMLAAEHAVMRNEALLALALVAAAATQLSEEARAELGEAAAPLCAILKAAKDAPTAFNALAVTKLLVPIAKESLKAAEMGAALKNLSLNEQEVTDEAQKVAALLGD